MRRPALPEVARIAKRTVLGLAIALVLLVAAWVLSNLSDIDPVPRPAVLALPKPQVPDERNAFFALIGLRAAADRDPAVAGKVAWQSQLHFATRLRELKDPKDAERLRQDEEQAMGSRLPSPAGPPLVCNSGHKPCAPTWIAQADALAVQRQALAVSGRRCEQWLDEHFEFEERLPPMQSLGEPIAVHGTGASHCSRWLQSGAVLAWVQGRAADSVVLLVKADRLNRGLLAGSNSLIAQMIAQRLARDALATIATLATRDRAMASALAPLLAPWPDQVQAARRWMVTEAAFQQGMLAEISRGCLSLELAADRDPTSWWDGIEGKLGSLACSHHIGLHPERTRAAFDQGWQHKLAALERGVPSAIVMLATENKAMENTGTLGTLTWRNPIGSVLVAVGEPAYASYLVRHADLDLHREVAALALAVQVAGIAAAERASWAATQPLSAATRARLSWSADGQTLGAKPWRDALGPGGYDAARDAIQVVWPTP